MRDYDTRRRAVAQARDDLMALHGTGFAKLFIALLDAVAEDKLAELATVTPDKLLYQQGMLAQVNDFRDLLTRAPPTPQITTA
jgi:hypothetical protein